MVVWLRRDLAAAAAEPRLRFLVAYFHHSPFMRGDHNSDDEAREPQSAFARARLLPLLEEAGVDLVLSGARTRRGPRCGSARACAGKQPPGAGRGLNVDHATSR